MKTIGSSRYLIALLHSTSFHMFELMRNHSNTELHRALERGWTKGAGPSMKIIIDFERGFAGCSFWQQVTQAGTNLAATAGTAHWQAGKIERHSQTIKEMLFATIRQSSPAAVATQWQASSSESPATFSG